MTKKQVVWLIIKLIGVYIVYSAIVALFVLIASIYAYVQLPAPPRFGKTDGPAANVQTISPGMPVNPTTMSTPPTTKTEIETPAEKAKNDALKELLWNLFLTVIYGLAGWYLIRDGRFLYAILNREAPFDESGAPAESDSFPLSRKKDNVVTTLNLSERPEAPAPPDAPENTPVDAAPEVSIDAPSDEQK